MHGVCNRLGALGFLVAVAYWPGLLSAPSTPRWWVLIAGLALVSSLDPRKLPPVIMWLLAATLAWALGLMILSPEIYGAPLHLILLLGLMATGIAGAEQDDLRPVLLPFGAGIGLSVLLGVSQVHGWWTPVPHSGMAGLFMNSEVLAITVAPLLVWALMRRQWALALVLLPVLIWGNSKVALVAIGVGLTYGLWAKIPSWIKVGAAMVMVAIPILFLLILVSVIKADGILYLLTTDGKFISMQARLMLWLTGIYSMTPFGMGLGGWAEAHPFAYEEIMHSDVLQLVTELGFGALFLLAIPVLIFRNRPPLAEGAAFAAVCVTCLLSFPLHTPAAGFLAAVLAGHLARVCLLPRLAASEGRFDGRSIARSATAQRPAVAHGSGRNGFGFPDLAAQSHHARHDTGRGAEARAGG